MKEMSRYLDAVIGSYHPSRLIGVGPVSRVYLAEERDSAGRVLVLKLFEAVPLEGPEERDQALDEMRLLACLEHPAILPILDDGLYENMLYLVEPYIEAGSLRQRLNTTTPGELLPLKEVMALLRQVSEALQCAHTQGIVHANLKPENILLQADGRVLLSDFLLPSLVKSERAARILSSFAALYMAPEQFQGHATPQSDQYSLACLAYELLTGQPPFEADDVMSLARKHATQEPLPPSQLQPKRVPHIDDVLLKALVKRPSGRYPDIQSFFAELSAPPPLVASVATMPETILGVAQPPEEPPAEAAIAPQVAFPPTAEVSLLNEAPVTAIPEQKTMQQPFQESALSVSALAEQATIQQAPLADLPTQSMPGIHDIETIVIPAPSPEAFAQAKAVRQLAPLPQAFAPARFGTPSRMSSRRVWLTVALVFLALIVSISGIALFWNANANHAQSTSVGKTSLAATSASTQTPANTTIPASAQSPTATATHKAKPTPRPTPSPTRAHPTATPTTGATPSPTATTVMASCQVNYQISSQWSNGFVANVMIKNTGKSSIQNWTLSFTFPGPEHIYSSWGGHVTQKHSQVTITSDGSNTTIAPGATVTPGFQALSGDNNSGDTPSSFTLNGMTCQ